MKRLVHDSDGVYMIDEECLRRKERKEQEKEMRWQKTRSSPKKNSVKEFPQR
ncbi:MAG: hypothetical protein IJ471_07005 [Eubacterium sp.]|nr:hypothetical protein [Eubacterium sp.]